MVAYAAVCERQRDKQGRRKNKTYVHVVTQTRTLNNVNSVAEWLAQNPDHPWNDSSFNEFIVEIGQQQYSDIQTGDFPLTYEGNSNLPRWQQETEGSGAAGSFGSFADPESKSSAFTRDVPLPDDRFIVRIFDNDPTTTGNHVAFEELDQNRIDPEVVRYLKLYDENDNPSSTNAKNQRTIIGGRLLDFDFTNGVAPFSLWLEKDGVIEFPSNGSYRIIGPDGETKYVATIYGKFLYPIS